MSASLLNNVSTYCTRCQCSQKHTFVQDTPTQPDGPGRTGWFRCVVCKKEHIIGYRVERHHDPLPALKKQLES